MDRMELGRGSIVRIYWTFGGTTCLSVEADD